MPRSMFVKDHMVTEVVTLHPDMEILRAAQVLIERDVSGAPVLDRHGRLIGRPRPSFGPGSKSRKNSASSRSKDRSPLGTIRRR